MIGMTQWIHPAMPELKLKVRQLEWLDGLPLPETRDSARIWMHRKRCDEPLRGPHRPKLPVDLSHMNPRLHGLSEEGVTVQQVDVSTSEQAPAKVSHPSLTMDARIRVNLSMMDHGHGPNHEARTLFSIPGRGPSSLNRGLNRTLLEQPPDLPCPRHLPRTDGMTRKGESEMEDRISEIHGPDSKVCR